MDSPEPRRAQQPQHQQQSEETLIRGADGSKQRQVTIDGFTFRVPARYRRLRALGRGSFGLVCMAQDSVTGGSVAIKKISPISADAVDARYALREIMVLREAGLHENIVTVHDVSYDSKDDAVYIIMELLASDLHRVNASPQPLSEDHLCVFMLQLLRGVAHLHESGVLHRDIKPANLLVSRECDLRISDFGLARAIGAPATDPAAADADLTEHVVTRWYRPPELMLSRNRAYDAAVDMWSVGCVFAELLGRKPMFPGRNFLHQLKLIFEVLGAPAAPETVHIKGVHARKFLRSVQGQAPKPWKEAFPKASEAALDLLSGLLVFDPAKRLTARAALSHRFFEPYMHVAFTEPEPFLGLHLSFENPGTTVKQIKALIMREVELYKRASDAAVVAAAAATAAAIMRGEGLESPPEKAAAAFGGSSGSGGGGGALSPSCALRARTKSTCSRISTDATSVLSREDSVELMRQRLGGSGARRRRTLYTDSSSSSSSGGDGGASRSQSAGHVRSGSSSSSSSSSSGSSVGGVGGGSRPVGDGGVNASVDSPVPVAAAAEAHITPLPDVNARSVATAPVPPAGKASGTRFVRSTWRLPRRRGAAPAAAAAAAAAAPAPDSQEPAAGATAAPAAAVAPAAAAQVSRLSSTNLALLESSSRTCGAADGGADGGRSRGGGGGGALAWVRSHASLNSARSSAGSKRGATAAAAAATAAADALPPIAQPLRRALSPQRTAHTPCTPVSPMSTADGGGSGALSWLRGSSSFILESGGARRRGHRRERTADSLPAYDKLVPAVPDTPSSVGGCSTAAPAHGNVKALADTAEEPCRGGGDAAATGCGGGRRALHWLRRPRGSATRAAPAAAAAAAPFHTTSGFGAGGSSVVRPRRGSGDAETCSRSSRLSGSSGLSALLRVLPRRA